MYEIYAGNNTLVFSDVTPAEEVKVIDPHLVMEDSASGSLTFTLPPSNAFYNQISPLLTELVVKEDGDEIWRGRVISDQMDFWKCKKVVCEGELSYLVDSIQPPKKYSVADTTIRTFLEALIAEHNRQMGSDTSKMFTVGYVAPDLDGDNQDDSDAINRFTNYETTLQCINEKLVSRLGGHIRIRHYPAYAGEAEGVRYIDYLKDYNDISGQEIRFGRNLLDFVQNQDATEWVTAIIPRGKRLDEAEIEGLEAYTTAKNSTIVDSWHASGSMVVKNPSSDVASYGFICTVVDWDDVAEPDNLVKKAKKYLTAVQWQKLVLEISAVDLHYLNPNINSLKVLDLVPCISPPHGMDTSFPVTKKDIDLSNPTNTKYTLGTSVYASLTSISSKMSNEVYNYIKDTPGESSILTSAKANAKALIEGTMDGGFASFIYGTDQYGVPIVDTSGNLVNPDRPTGIIVQNDHRNRYATQRWLWTWGGFGHQTKASGTDAWTGLPNIALTMDGHIVCDAMTTGRIVLAGKRNSSGTYDRLNTPGFLEVYNGLTKIGKWDSDGIYIRTGSIEMGSPIKFTVNSDGELTAIDGLFKGTIRGSTFNTVDTTATNAGVFIHGSRIEMYGHSSFAEDPSFRVYSLQNSRLFAFSATAFRVDNENPIDIRNLYQVAAYYASHGGW